MIYFVCKIIMAGVLTLVAVMLYLWMLWGFLGWLTRKRFRSGDGASP